ncbi:MAG TPA: lysylphosphatidylglycerol synthase transmembrane domain-containing protein [Flavobacteriaceae bacterium]|nr:lysylphosphatidylglycerol synthase transmembrane domain-containing protein [Flavobacteriaceae bacterium]
MKTTTKKAIKILIPIVLAIFFGWYTFSQIPVSEIIPYFKKADYSWIIIGVFCGVLSHLSRAYRWRYLLEPLGYKVSFPNRIMAVFIGYLTNYGIPRSGEVLRAAAITNYEKVPFEKSFGTIVAERAADLLVMLGIVAITLILQFDYIFGLLEQSIPLKKLLILGVVGLILVFLLVLFIKKSKGKFAQKLKTFMKGLLEGATSILKMEHKWAFIAHTLFIWIMYIMMFYITTFSIEEVSGLSVGAILVSFIATSLTIAATNSGLFVYPLAVAATFSLFGIPELPSIAFGWIVWSSQTLMVILFGVLSFIFLPIYNQKPHK